MAVSILPISNDDESYEQSYGIDSSTLTFQFRYNSRNDTWYMDILDEQNVVRFSGMPCLTNVITMTRRIDYSVFLTGEIIFLDLGVEGTDCTRENFGESITLAYQNGG